MNEVTFWFGSWASVLRVLVVGTGAYLALVLLLRVGRKRTLARLNAFDFIVTVALGASFGRVLTARDTALADAVAAFALLVALQWAVSAIQVRHPAFANAVTAPPALLFYRGRFLREAMRRERIAERELRAVARERGMGSLNEVEAIVFEADGQVAVISKGAVGDGSALEATWAPDDRSKGRDDR